MSPGRDPRGRLPLRGVQLCLGLGLVLAACYSLRTLDLPTLQAALRRTAWPLVAVVVALNLGAALCRAGYWWMVLSPLGTFRAWDVVRLTFAALAGNMLAPAYAGDAFKVWQLKRVFGVRVSLSLAAVGLEKLGELVAMLLLVAPLPWLVPSLPAQAQLALKLTCIGCAGVLGALWLARRRLGQSISRWLASVSLLASSPRLALGLCGLFAVWVLDVTQIRLLMVALGIQVGLGAALLVLLLVNLAIALPVSPGNLGTHELGSVAALTLLGVPATDALIFALLYHATQAIPIVWAGLPNVWALLAAKRWQEAET